MSDIKKKKKLEDNNEAMPGEEENNGLPDENDPQEDSPKEESLPNLKELVGAIQSLEGKIDAIKVPNAQNNGDLSGVLKTINDDLKAIEEKLDSMQKTAGNGNYQVVADSLAGLKQTIGELPAKFDRLKASLDEFSNRTKQSFENLNNRSNGTNSASYSDISQSVRNAVQNSPLNSKVADVASSVKTLKTDIAEIKGKAEDATQAKIWAIDSSAKGTFLTFTITFAIICILSGFFMVTGWSSCSNEALLKATLSFVAISVLSMLLFHSLYAIFDSYDASIIYYITEIIINIVALGLSIAVLVG